MSTKRHTNVESESEDQLNMHRSKSASSFKSVIQIKITAILNLFPIEIEDKG